ncbi:hypothetical protein J2Z22_002298 [Paenibacillus forsythiae]|uniref:Uncharacterized protein n=1 Tax=Paenibacillus forsythiae TaxID=365616 RepID=A0ABU3H7F6_9BACL|nr:hypothetical protein [Paenibacillus forsythiae]MDT3426764.1 hypothetical protein [Paenibacillus forsythiae]
MAKDNRQELEEREHAPREQRETMRDFIEEETGKPHSRGPVDEATSHVPDTQNHFISERNFRKYQN